MPRLLIESEAEADLTEAFAWYERQRPGLGEEFLLAVEACLAEIQRRPRSFVSAVPDVRRALLRRFPFGVFFVESGGTNRVIAVLHARRNPATWRKRI